MSQDNFDILHKLKAPFPKDQIKQREGPKKNGRAMMFSYVPASALQARLDEVLGPKWNWEIISSSIQTFNKTKAIWENGKKVGEEQSKVDHVIVHGRLTIILPDETKVIRDSFGGCETSYGTAAGDPHKIADSSAFRKACDKLGLAQEVGGEENSNAAANSAPFTNKSFTQPAIASRPSNPFIKS